ncbi:MAG: hypothetical protein ACREXT_10295, partial [Gammaproteobacteria bacterium]
MIERENLGYIISTVVGYEAPLTRLLASMPMHAHCAIVAGRGGNRTESETSFGISVNVPHNSFDYTALIDLVEYPDSYPDWSHVFLLHDTMELGPQSDILIRSVDPTLASIAAWGGECNLCLYRVDYLASRRDEIVALKDCTKLRAVQAEGFLWRTLSEGRRGSSIGEQEITEPTAAYAGAPRRRIYYA